MTLIKASIEMISSEDEAKRCFSRSQCAKKVRVAVHRHEKSTDF